MVRGCCPKESVRDLRPVSVMRAAMRVLLALIVVDTFPDVKVFEAVLKRLLE